jgi:hypothetical protein
MEERDDTPQPSLQGKRHSRPGRYAIVAVGIVLVIVALSWSILMLVTICTSLERGR